MNKTTKATTILLGVGIGAVLLKKWLGNKPLKADVVSENAPASSDEPCRVCANVEKVPRKTRKRITKQMVREWSKLAKQGVTHKKDCTKIYFMSLIPIDRNLNKVNILKVNNN